MDKIEFYNMIFSYFSELIPNDFKKVVFLIDASEVSFDEPVLLEFYVFLDDSSYIPWYELPLHSELYQKQYNQFVSFFKENYLSIAEFTQNNILTLVFTCDGQVTDEYEMLNSSDNPDVKSLWHNGWFDAFLNSNYDLYYGDECVDSDALSVNVDSVSDAFLKLYPNQEEHLYWHSFFSHKIGGSDPVSGISAYDGGYYYHVVTEGCSDCELTFLLRKNSESDSDELNNVLSILQIVARSILNGEQIDLYDYVYDGTFTGIDFNKKSDITGLITVPDPYVSDVDGLKMMCLVGITTDELKALIDKKITVSELYDRIGNAITDYDRESVMNREV